MCFCIIMLLKPLSTLTTSCNFMTGNWFVYNTFTSFRRAPLSADLSCRYLLIVWAARGSTMLSNHVFKLMINKKYLTLHCICVSLMPKFARLWSDLPQLNRFAVCWCLHYCWCSRRVGWWVPLLGSVGLTDSCPMVPVLPGMCQPPAAPCQGAS